MGIGFCGVRENLLNKIFCCAVGVCSSAGFHCFVKGGNIVFSVNRCRRTENHFLTAVFRHYFAERNRTADVVLIIEQGFFTGFSNGFEPCKMNNRVDIMFFKYFFKTFSVPYITFFKCEIFAGKFPDSVKNFGTTVIEVVKNNNFLSCVQ